MPLVHPILGRGFSGLAGILILALAGASRQGLRAEEGRSAPLGGKASWTLCENASTMRLGLESGPAYLGLGVDASEDGSYFLGCLQAGGDRGDGSCLLAGPGSSSGSLRFLVDPASTTLLSPGAPVSLDRSLSSRTSIAFLRAGPLSLFGLCEGEGPFAFASRPEGAERSMGAAAGGASLCFELPEYRFEALASASYAKERSPASGWRPEPYASPALEADDTGRPVTQTAFIVERGRADGGALVAVSSSYGELAGAAGALRVQAREESGDMGLRLSAAAADPSYRALYGKPEEKLLGAAAELSLFMRRSASLTLSAELEAEGRGLRYAPLWGRGKALKLVLPLSAEHYRFLETRLEAKRSAEGDTRGSSSFTMKSGKAEEGGAAAAGAKLEWERRFDGLEFSLSTDLAGKGGLPALGLDIGLELFDGASEASPVLAKGGIDLSFPCGESGALRLDVDLPETGAVLAPRAHGPAGKGAAAEVEPVFSLRYKASFGSPRRRPRPVSRAGRLQSARPA
jgi:hypothetical protein